jgi:hypothetical protein
MDAALVGSGAGGAEDEDGMGAPTDGGGMGAPKDGGGMGPPTDGGGIGADTCPSAWYWEPSSNRASLNLIMRGALDGGGIGAGAA